MGEGASPIFGEDTMLEAPSNIVSVDVPELHATCSTWGATPVRGFPALKGVA